MVPKTSNSFPEGRAALFTPAGYAACVASALRKDLGGTHRAVKMICRWTGVGERTATNWLAAENGPSGAHLAELARHSDAVLNAFLVMAGREQAVVEIKLSRMRLELVAMLNHVDNLLNASPAGGRDTD